jgi:hypothetical protein
MAQSKGQQVQNGDRDAKLFSCFWLIVGPSKELVLFSKNSLSTGLTDLVWITK